MVDVQRSFLGIVNGSFELLTDSANTIWAGPALLFADSVLCALILRMTDYTEIDWNAYMQQIALYTKGYRDYTNLVGDTGPLVYPAGHVYIYRALSDLTNDGSNIIVAQIIFAVFYIITVGLVMACYRNAKAPPYIFPMLVLSKRLHSIYMLRCFNDGIVTMGFFLTIYLLQTKRWTIASIVFSLALSVKMSLLLALPAFTVILYQAVGGSSAFRQLVTIGNIQILLALPFLRRNWKGYIGRAFELTRTFKYEWTVNWKFIDEEIFLSRSFALSLLALHVFLLGFFIYTRWLRPIQLATGQRQYDDLFDVQKEVQDKVLKRLTPQYILTTMLTANVIGMLCARSLHFQFYAWLGWATPFLLWRAKLNPMLQYFLWIGQEVAWNVYPSQDLSSKIVVGMLALTMVEVWLGTEEKTDQVPVSLVFDEGLSRRVQQTDEDRLYRALAREE